MKCVCVCVCVEGECGGGVVVSLRLSRSSNLNIKSSVSRKMKTGGKKRRRNNPLVGFPDYGGRGGGGFGPQLNKQIGQERGERPSP